MKNLNISIAGLGNVGSAVVNVIEDNSSYLEKKSNLNLNIIGLSAKNINKERSFDTKKYKWVETPIDLLNINDLKPEHVKQIANQFLINDQTIIFSNK